MYPASESAGWRTVAQVSRTKLWAIFLLCFTHRNRLSPHLSCGHPHGHNGGVAVFSKSGIRSFRFMVMRKLQLGSLFLSLLQFMEMSG